MFLFNYVAHALKFIIYDSRQPPIKKITVIKELKYTILKKAKKTSLCLKNWKNIQQLFLIFFIKFKLKKHWKKLHLLKI